MKFLRLILVTICVTFSESFSQTPSQTQIIPPTPNAASIAQYGNIPIGLYTGQPNVSFPIYVIDNGHVKVPINLSYNYNGLKLEEYPSWVGTGWTLNATSVITRQTRSLPDESNGGYNGPNQRGVDIQSYINLGVTPETPNVNFQTSYPFYYSLLNGITMNSIDSEPDMFVFSCPGYSGKFYFDESQCGTTVKTAKVIPAQNITIKGYFDYDYVFSNIRGQITKFEIIDERGNLYTFDVKERSAASRLEDVDSGSPDLDFQNSWYLSSITDSFSQTIQYTYTTRKIHLPPTLSQRLVLPDEFTSTPKYAENSSWEVVLDHITSRNHTNDILARVDFIEETTERLDWHSEAWEGYEVTDHQQPKALEKIKVTVHGKVIKEVKFTYGYFGNNARLRLDKFQETNNGTAIPAYEFTYLDNFQFPKIGDRSSLLSQDHWGYYRGTSESTLLTPVKIVNGQGAVIADIPGNDRSPVPGAASVGILTTIKYPTGGTTQFEYEPNDYNPDLQSFSVPSAVCGNDMVLKKRAFAQWTAPLGPNNPTQPPQDELNYEVPFEITGPAGHTVCVRVEYTLDRGDCSDDRALVAIYDPSITQIWTRVLFKTAFQSTEAHASAVEYLDLLPGQYKLQALVESVNGCDAYNKIKNKAIIKVYAPDESNPNRIASGMRVSKVVDCPSTDNNTGCISKFFSYEDEQIPGHSSGSLVNGPTYIYPTTIIRELSWEANGYVVSSQSQVPIVTTMGNNVGYRYVTVTEAEDGSKGKGVHKFTSPADYSNTGSGSFPFGDPQEYPYPPFIDNDWKRGIDVHAREYKANSPNPITETTVTPDFPTVSTTKGLKMAPKFTLTDGTAEDASLAMEGLKGYYFVPYDIKIGWQKIVNQSNTIFDDTQGANITTTSTMSYANPSHLQLTRKETISSTGTTLATTYKYKADLASISGLTTTEITGIQNSPLTSTVIEEKNFEGATLLSTKRNLFDGSKLSKIQQSLGTAQLSDEVTFNSYDARGSVTSYTTRSGQTHSFIYGYNQTLPIAEAINAIPQDIFYDGFEDLAVTADAGAKTGERVLSSSSFTFPLSYAPTSPSNTKMSYWYWANNTWNYSGELPFSSTFTSSGSKIDDVRAYPKGAIMTTYAYKPGNGIRSVTDANGLTKYFEYDDLGRLKMIQDDKKNIEKHFTYHYKGTPE